MDPNLFHMDYERLFEVLVTIVVLFFFIERALSVIFESRLFVEWNEVHKLIDYESDGNVKVNTTVMNASDDDTTPPPPAKPPSGKKRDDIKELIALIVSITTCAVVQFDALTIILAIGDQMTHYGIALTGAIIAGGSKASMALFKDVMNFMSTAEKQRLAIDKTNANK